MGLGLALLKVRFNRMNQKCFALLQEISVAKEKLYPIYLSSLRFAYILINL